MAARAQHSEGDGTPLLKRYGHLALIGALSLAITLYWGTTCSLVLATVYVPAAGWLRSRLVALLREQPKLEDPQEWLREQGLAVSPLQYAREVAVMLAPLGAAPISSAISRFIEGAI